MTKTQVDTLIDVNLANGSTITPPEHRAVEHAIVDFVVQEDALKVDKVTGKSLVLDTEITRLAAITGTNTGDETATSIKSKLSITTLSGSNTGDQDISGIATNTSAIGTLSSLTTSTKANLVAALNEVKAVADTAAGGGTVVGDATVTNVKLASDVKVGSLATLNTTAKASVVAAINEVKTTADAKTTNITDAASASLMDSKDATVITSAATAAASANKAASTITEDATHRFATDTEKTTWNSRTTNITDTASASLMDTKDAVTLTTIRGGVVTAGDNLSKLYALIQTLNTLVTGTTPDGDSVTNTIQEIVTIFATYPEGVDVATVLAGKINTSAIVNTLVETSTGKVLDATQGKALKDLIDTLTGNVYIASTYATYASALAAATGTQKRSVKVTADENNGNITTYYKYEGSAGVLVPDFDKFSSTFFDTVGGEIVPKDASITLAKLASEVTASFGGAPETATTIGTIVSGATAKTTPVDADNFAGTDSAASNVLKKFTWANIKTAMAAYLATSAPSTLDTLDELAQALGDDPNFATTIATALGLKAPLASPAFTGTVSGITKSMVGLGSVDNTPDASKPVSTLQATAIANAKVASLAITGTTTKTITLTFGDGTTVSNTFTDLSGTNAAPTVSSVAFTGTPTQSQTLTGTYTYADAESDTQGTSIKQWYRSDNTSALNRTAITGATNTTYVLQAADVGKYIQYAVTPVATTGTTTGTITYSSYSAVIASNALPTNIVAEGDSLTQGFNSAGGGSADVVSSPTDTTKSDYPNLMRTDLGTTSYTIRNTGLSGDTIASMITQFSGQVNVYYDATNYSANVLIIWGGTNDIATNAAEETVYQNIRSYCVTARAAGWKVIVLNMLERTTNFTAPMDATLFAPIRQSINDRMAVEWPNYADAFCDVYATHPELNGAWDGTHPSSSAGYILIKNAVKSTLLNLLSSGTGYTGATLTPAAPTSGVVNDTSKTFDWTNVSGFSGVNNYEYLTDGGTTYAAVTTKPIIVSGAVAIGNLKLRVKAAAGRNASAVLSNATAFTAGSSYDTDAQAFFTAASIANSTQQGAVNQLVLDLKSAGIWTKMKALYPFVGGTSTTHKWNLKDPRDLDAAFRLTFPNGATHSANGVDWNGTNQYARTFLSPATSLAAASAHISYYSRSNINRAESDMGIDGDPGIDLQIGYQNGGRTKMFGSTNGTTTQITVSDTRGFFLSSRISTTSLTFYRNGTSIATQTGSSTTAITTLTGDIFIGSLSAGGTVYLPTTKQCAFASIGSGLTSTEVTSFQTAVNTFQTALTRNV
jgi:hypothetical protein